MTEEFEKWMNDWCARNPNPATVLQEQTVWAAAWQASRKAALDDVIACIEEHKDYRGGYVDNGIEDEIRALQQQQ